MIRLSDDRDATSERLAADSGEPTPDARDLASVRRSLRGRLPGSQLVEELMRQRMHDKRKG